MTGYADPELLLSKWLNQRLSVKVWADPRLPQDWPFSAPLVHLQRGQGEGDTQITLDTVLLDVDVYAKNADHARATAEDVRSEMRLNLPLVTLPGGAFVKSVSTVSAPAWTPDPDVFRRSAAYRVYLHSLI